MYSEEMLIEAFKKVIEEFELSKYLVRDIVPMELWEVLDLVEYYKVVEVTATKEVKATFNVLMPYDVDTDYVADYFDIDDIEISSYTLMDESEFEIDDCEVVEEKAPYNMISYETINDIDNL